MYTRHPAVRPTSTLPRLQVSFFLSFFFTPICPHRQSIRMHTQRIRVPTHSRPPSTSARCVHYPPPISKSFFCFVCFVYTNLRPQATHLHARTRPSSTPQVSVVFHFLLYVDLRLHARMHAIHPSTHNTSVPNASAGDVLAFRVVRSQ